MALAIEIDLNFIFQNPDGKMPKKLGTQVEQNISNQSSRSQNKEDELQNTSKIKTFSSALI